MAQRARRTAQRIMVVALLAVVGVLSLPVAATLLDGQGTENWILPSALIGTAVVGAGVGSALPEFAGVGATAARGAVVGALIGIIMSLFGGLLFFLLISGLVGA